MVKLEKGNQFRGSPRTPKMETGPKSAGKSRAKVIRMSTVSLYMRLRVTGL